MKKIIYSLLFAFTITLSISSCTEEEVKPTVSKTNGGGGYYDDGFN